MRFRRLGGDYCYGIGIEGMGFGEGFTTSFRWNRFCSLDAAAQDAKEHLLRRIAAWQLHEDKKIELDRLAKMIESDECVERVDNWTDEDPE